jgi:hypothetical protein
MGFLLFLEGAFPQAPDNEEFPSKFLSVANRSHVAIRT